MLDLEETGELDITAAGVFVELPRQLERQDIQLYSTRVHEPVREVLRRDGLIERIGEDRIYASVHGRAEGFRDSVGGEAEEQEVAPEA